MRRHLVWKLFAVNLPAIGVVILVIWIAINYLAADYFSVLMEKYHVSPTTTHQMFLDAVHRYLLWASLLAIACAMLCSFFLTRKVLRPLSQMTAMTPKLAAGQYTERVHIASQDEVGQLGAAFNHMADSLQRIEQLRRTMVSDVAHELRTPLTNMRGYLEALRDGVIDPTSVTFDLLHEETLRLVKLVEALLQLTQAEAARMTLTYQDLKVREWIEQALELFQPQFENKAIHVTLDTAADVNVIRADADKLTQALRNLLQNAWQYTPTGGRVRLSIRHQGDLVLRVSNSGGGIPQADLPFIFERFYRGEKSRSREHGGAGIGLAIVKELIEAHGGRVGAASAAGMTHLWIELPA
jgi:two-component system, OmpR family, sensor histidine kinase BaeS